MLRFRTAWILVPILLAASCRNFRLRRAAVPEVLIRTPGGFEQGVSTTEGVLFLARTADRGPAKVHYEIEGAPVVEAGTIRTSRGPIRRVDLEVPIPSAPISFDPIRPGESLLLMIRKESGVLSYGVRVPVEGPLLGDVVHKPSGLELGPEQVGAGVFRSGREGPVLVGLVKGVAEVEGGGAYLLLAALPEFRATLLTPRRSVERIETRYRADGTRIRVRK